MYLIIIIGFIEVILSTFFAFLQRKTPKPVKYLFDIISAVIVFFIITIYLLFDKFSNNQTVIFCWQTYFIILLNIIATILYVLASKKQKNTSKSNKFVLLYIISALLFLCSLSIWWLWR